MWGTPSCPGNSWGPSCPTACPTRWALTAGEKLRGTRADLFVMAHRGMCTREELEALIDDNQALAQQRAGEVAGPW